MRKKIAIALTAGVAAATVGFGAAGTASAAPKGAGEGGKPLGISCMQYGHSVLRSSGSPAKASQDILKLPLDEVLPSTGTSPPQLSAFSSVWGSMQTEVVAACGEPA